MADRPSPLPLLVSFVLGMLTSCGQESKKPAKVEYVTAAQLFSVTDFKGDKGHKVEIVLTNQHEGVLVLLVEVKISEFSSTGDGTKVEQSWKKTQDVTLSAKDEKKKLTFTFPQTNPDKMDRFIGGELKTEIWRNENGQLISVKELHNWLKAP